MRDGFNKLLEVSDIGLDAEGNKFVPYSCRHYFITSGLRRGVDAYDLANNCGTSIEMIKTYYDGTVTEDHITRLIQGLPSYNKKDFTVRGPFS